MIENYIDCLFNDKILLQSQQRSKSDCHNVCTEQIIRLQTFNKITTYPFGKNAFKVCESEMLSKI